MQIGPIVLDCARVGAPDLATIEAIARIALAGRRSRSSVMLVNAGERLCGLIELCGLSAALGVEVERQSEDREQALRVEEERELADPPFREA